MNYRHAFHAGNFADVVKHIILTRLVEYLKKKDAASLSRGDSRRAAFMRDWCRSAPNDAKAKRPRGSVARPSSSGW